MVVVLLLLLLVAGVERRMSQRGKGDGPPPPMGFTDRGPCLQMALCKRSLFSSALSLSSLLLLVRRLIVFAAYLACLIGGWRTTPRARGRRELFCLDLATSAKCCAIFCVTKFQLLSTKRCATICVGLYEF